MFHCLLT